MSNTVCRVCLKNDPTLYNLFELVVVDEEENQIPLHEMLSFCCSTTIVDNPPQSICTNCIEDCSKAYNFIKLFHKNNITFTKLYDDKIKRELGNFEGENDVKIEIIEDPNSSKNIKESDTLSIQKSIEIAEKPTKSNINKISATDKIIKTPEKCNIANKSDKTIKNSNIEKVAPVEKNHICPICKERFVRYSFYVNHLKGHTDKFKCHLCEGSYENCSEFQEHYFRDHYNSCSICEISFVSRKEFHNHIAIKHKELVKPRVFNTNRTKQFKKIDFEMSVHVCPVCQEELKYSTKFAKHMRENHSEEQVDCNKCEDSFPNSSEFIYHYVRRHYNYCDICDLGFDQRDNFNKHQRLHLERECFVITKAFDCPLCNIQCLKFKDFVNHLEEKHEGGITCNICQKVSDSVDEFIVHYEEEHRIKCEKCGAFCSTRKQFDEHINKKFVKNREAESKIEDKSLTESIKRLKSGNNKHICPICQTEFRYLAEFRLHIRNMHIDYDNETPVTCNYCDNVCSNLPEFISHYQNVHYIQCGQCGKFFTHKTLLKEHKCRPKSKPKHVTLNVPKVCTTCGKSYLGSLKKHEEMHKNTYSYKCDLCNMKFIKYDQMRYHRLKKHNLMKHLCTDCGQRFVNKTQLTIHMWKHKGVKGYSCKDCGQKFFRPESVRKHERKQLCGKRRGSHKKQTVIVEMDD